MTEYKVNGQVKYWATKASAVRVMNQLFDKGDLTFWVPACDENGWYLENLDEIEVYS